MALPSSIVHVLEEKATRIETGERRENGIRMAGNNMEACSMAGWVYGENEREVGGMEWQQHTN